MKPIFFYSIITILYLSVPVISIGFVGTLYTYEYQVKQARIFNEINKKNISESEFKQKAEEINNDERKLRFLQFGLVTSGIILCIVPTAMIIKRRKIKRKNSFFQNTK